MYASNLLKKTNELLEVVSQIGEKHHATNAHMSLAWMINKYDFCMFYYKSLYVLFLYQMNNYF